MHILLKRVVALLIDYLIVYVATRIIGIIFGLIMLIFIGLLFIMPGDSFTSLGDSFFNFLSSISANVDDSNFVSFLTSLLTSLIIHVLSIIIGLFPYWLYFAILESSHFQGTLGKKIMKLKVIGLNGNRISFKTASKRFLARPEALYAYITGLIMTFIFNIFMRFETGGVSEQVQIYNNYSWFFDRLNENNLSLLFFLPFILVVGINYYVYKNSEREQSLHDLFSKTLVREIEEVGVLNDQVVGQLSQEEELFSTQPLENSGNIENLKWQGGNYNGQIKAGIPNGQGELVMPDNKSYHGEWVMGKPEGYGRLINNSEIIYAGYLKSGKRHGLGVYKKSDGTIYAGKWESGKLVKRTIEYESYFNEIFINKNVSIDAIASSLNITKENALLGINEMIKQNILENAIIDRNTNRIILKELPESFQTHNQNDIVIDQNTKQQKFKDCQNCHHPLMIGEKYCTNCGTASFKNS